MPKVCKSCGASFSVRAIIDGSRKNLCNRENCLTCVPFGVRPSATAQQRREKNRQKYKNWYNRSKQERVGFLQRHRERRKRLIVTLCGGKCQFCGYDRWLGNLTFHHLREKKFSLSSQWFQLNAQEVVEEILKCALCCNRCHGEIHGGLVPNEEAVRANAAIITALSCARGKSWEELATVTQLVEYHAENVKIASSILAVTTDKRDYD